MDLRFFICQRPYYSRLPFDSCRNKEIGCMYWYDIGNNFFNSNSLVTRNVSKVGREKDLPQHMGVAQISKNQ